MASTTLGQRLAAARIAAGLTREDSASLRRCSLSTIQKYELDRVTPPLPVLAQLAVIYGVTLADLVGDLAVQLSDDPAVCLAGTA